LKKSSYLVAAIVVLALIGTAGYLWQQQQMPATTAPVASAAPPLVAAVAPAAPPPSAASEPAVKYPIEAPVDNQQAAAPDMEAALTELFGHKTVLSAFQTDDFARRFVATVDNLGRAHAPVAVWPVNPTPGQLVVEKKDGAEVIGADNGLRYTAFVLIVQTVDPRKAVATYARLYPQLQRAYEDLGFPKRYFNDRLVEVIDLLLATPEVDQPLKIHLPQINGPLKPGRPWLLYEIDEPALQSLAAGQKILLRMGPANERRVKSKLMEIRQLLTAGTLPR
jgi:hypothetical protein